MFIAETGIDDRDSFGSHENICYVAPGRRSSSCLAADRHADSSCKQDKQVRNAILIPALSFIFTLLDIDLPKKKRGREGRERERESALSHVSCDRSSA